MSDTRDRGGGGRERRGREEESARKNGTWRQGSALLVSPRRFGSPSRVSTSSELVLRIDYAIRFESTIRPRPRRGLGTAWDRVVQAKVGRNPVVKSFHCSLRPQGIELASRCDLSTRPASGCGEVHSQKRVGSGEGERRAERYTHRARWDFRICAVLHERLGKVDVRESGRTIGCCQERALEGCGESR